MEAKIYSEFICECGHMLQMKDDILICWNTSCKYHGITFAAPSPAIKIGLKED